ncbi:Acylphosphatase-1, putative [Pediculus humanus corporis]|uniref:Acylphosphatase n=1 Tax=Pediculus humanus subsp. corporis TaxID=121224 RepID=E0VW38_PEDHC|nr:Acylphosphatase-1, putative [Pediculus humanus corporis]EEB17593.1 Acylphosphatase-1, putative [Pediculus humanus corporis]
MSLKLLSVDFEIHGKVQGVYFRKHTQEQGNQLGVRGWCMNTTRGTVIGNLQGTPDKILKMKNWLSTKGSPKSKITKAYFSNEQSISEYTQNEFIIKK